MGPFFLQHALPRPHLPTPPALATHSYELESEQEWRLRELAKLLAKGYLRLRETRLRASLVSENPSLNNSDNSQENGLEQWGEISVTDTVNSLRENDL